MNDEEIKAAAEALLKRTRTDKGLSYHVEDPEILDIVANAIRILIR